MKTRSSRTARSRRKKPPSRTRTRTPTPPNNARPVQFERIVAGTLTGVFGVRGELKCRPTAIAGGAVAAGRSYALGGEPDAAELRCTAVRRHHEKLLLTFEGVADPEAARAYVGRELYVERAAVRLEPGEYFDSDLIGLRLLDEAGNELGEVVAVEHYPAQDCLVVGARRALVPLVHAFVRRIDVERRAIVTSLPDGLLEGQAAEDRPPPPRPPGRSRR